MLVLTITAAVYRRIFGEFGFAAVARSFVFLSAVSEKLMIFATLDWHRSIPANVYTVNT